MRTLQYTFILVTQIVLVGVVFACGAKVLDLSLAKVRAPFACNVDRPAVGQGQVGLRQYLSC